MKPKLMVGNFNLRDTQDLITLALLAFLLVNTVDLFRIYVPRWVAVLTS